MKLDLLRPSTMAQNDLSIYAPGLVNLWYPIRTHVTIEQFVREYIRRNPELQLDPYGQFPCVFYTRPNNGRPRQVIINPNSKNAFQAFLYDVRCAMGDIWNNAMCRARLLLNGRPLEAAGFVPTIRSAVPYSLVVESDPNGVLLPVDNPIAGEIAQRQLADARRRAARIESNATQETAVRKVPILAVIDTATKKFGASMTDLSMRVNRANPQSQFRVMAEPTAARTLASQALRDPTVYKEFGYTGADDFFTRGLGASSSTQTIDALSCEMAARTSKMPTFIKSNDPESLKQFYTSKAIGGSLISQWTGTVRSWLGKNIGASNDIKYRLQPNYNLVVCDRNNNVVSLNPTPIKSNIARTTQPIASIFEPHAFAKKAEQLEAQVQRAEQERELLRGLQKSSPVAAPISRMPVISIPIPGESIGAPIGSMPPLVPIASGIQSSMPPLVPIANGIQSSMPPLIPYKPIACDVCSDGDGSMPPATPINALVTSMPTAVPIKAPVASKPTAAPIKASVTSKPSAASKKLAKLGTPLNESDPLLDAFVKFVRANIDKYSGFILPGDPSLDGDLRAKFAQMITENPMSMQPYLFYTNMRQSLVSLMSSQSSEKMLIDAANGKDWYFSKDEDSRVFIHIRSTDERVAVEIKKKKVAKKHPKIFVIHAHITKAEGQV